MKKTNKKMIAIVLVLALAVGFCSTLICNVSYAANQIIGFSGNATAEGTDTVKYVLNGKNVLIKLKNGENFVDLRVNAGNPVAEFEYDDTQRNNYAFSVQSEDTVTLEIAGQNYLPDENGLISFSTITADGIQVGGVAAYVPATVQVQFDSATISGNVITFAVDDTTNVTATVAPVQAGKATWDGTNLEIVESELNNVKFTLGDTFDSSTMNVVVRGSNNYSTNLIVNGDNEVTLGGLNLPDGGVHLSIELKESGSNPSDQPSDGEFDVNEIDVTRVDFRLNGEDITVTSENTEITVDANMNFEGVDEFYITKVVIHDNENNTDRTYDYAAGEYSIGLKDAENRSILEVNLGKQTTNLAFLRIEAHTEDLKASDIAAMGKTSDDFYHFYLPQIKLIKPGFKGLVEVSTPHMPDVYDFVSFNGFELGDTSESNYANVTVYYGDDTINLTSLGSNITNIELVNGKGVLPSAVEIDVANKKVKIKSNYYNEIPLKITAQLEGEQTVVGYVKITRVGIYINDLNKGATVFFHGAFNAKVNENGGNLKVDTDKQRLVAVFYHSNTTTVNDYDLVLNIVNKDGTRETKLAKAVGDVPDENNSPLVGSDYIIWEGDSIEDRPSKIYVTAVKKGATSNSNTFGGATFGAGAGITWTKD
ncbi:MAG: hypothetical protein J6M60_04620 [Clostridia bacterium]|nr:hypothetical protein [Clostridia bacterium]